MNEPCWVTDDLSPHEAVVACPENRRESRTMPIRRSLHQLRLIHLVLIPLMALTFWTGCSHWVPITSRFGNGHTRRLAEVRIGGAGGEVLKNADIKWPMLTITTDGSPVTIDLRQMPGIMKQFSDREYDAIVSGGTRTIDEVSEDGEVFVNATIRWPKMFAFKRSPVTIDLRLRPAERRSTTVDLDELDAPARTGGLVLSGPGRYSGTGGPVRQRGSVESCGSACVATLVTLSVLGTMTLFLAVPLASGWVK